MRIHFRIISATSGALAVVFAVWFPASLNAAPAKEAQVTAVIKDVTLLSPEAEPRPAVLKDEVVIFGGGTLVSLVDPQKQTGAVAPASWGTAQPTQFSQSTRACCCRS
ncbi:MAG TPA: hypothetical protein VGZ31_05145 [Chthoniobacterales bacterium]|nr:hypothetical protein [Chthoniobacterales bacterium]